jgi:EF-hand domain pair
LQLPPPSSTETPAEAVEGSSSATAAVTVTTRASADEAAPLVEAEAVAPPAPPVVTAVANSEEDAQVEALLMAMAPMMSTVQSRVNEADFEKLFKDLDTDGSGDLDPEEMRAFLTGRYDMDKETVQKVFARFDQDNSKKVDFAEFKEMCRSINAKVKEFDEKDDKADQCDLMWVAYCAQFGCMCCLCTAGISCYVYTCCAARSVTRIAQRGTTKTERLNKKLTHDLPSMKIER